MNELSVLCFAVLISAFIGAYLWNSGVTDPNSQAIIKPPYHFNVGSNLYAYSSDTILSFINAFFFTFIFSLLFFGYAAPIAMAIEGMKYGSLISLNLIPYYDALFLVPQLIACVAATLIGQGIIYDYKGEGNIFEYWRRGAMYFTVSLIFLLLLLFTRQLV